MLKRGSSVWCEQRDGGRGLTRNCSMLSDSRQQSENGTVSRLSVPIICIIVGSPSRTHNASLALATLVPNTDQIKYFLSTYYYVTGIILSQNNTHTNTITDWIRFASIFVHERSLFGEEWEGPTKFLQPGELLTAKQPWLYHYNKCLKRKPWRSRFNLLAIIFVCLSLFNKSVVT